MNVITVHLIIKSSFIGDITLKVEWKDWRIKFKDLKEAGNYLNRYWQSQIWLPPLYFSNTVGNVPILIDDTMTVKVRTRILGIL